MKRYSDLIGDGGSNILEQVQAQAKRLEGRLAEVSSIVAVMSGKGGVGKSSLTVCIADSITMAGRKVGIVDADINGASVVRMTGVGDQKVAYGPGGARPATSSLGVRIMGIDLFLDDKTAPVLWKAPTQKDGFTWRGMMETAAVREFISDTEWGSLDTLLVDLPPGTDSLPNLVDVLPKFSGAVIVTLPSGVSRLVVERSAKMARDVIKAPVLGLIENCSYYVCPHCGKAEGLYPDGDSKSLADDLRIPFLGRIPFDPLIAQASDQGVSYMQTHRDRPAAVAIDRISRSIDAASTSLSQAST
ncbi:MAG TPA: P-loop NTPase [Rhodothermia bacterium]